MEFLRKLFAPAQRPAPPAAASRPAPDAPFYVIGDIHGRDDLLALLLARIAREDANATIVCVGDYVDRGDGSAEVLRRLSGADAGTVCLLGNHEEMLLNFLDEPARHGPRWLRHGGLQTLASYGVRGVSEVTSGGPLITARDALRAAIGPTQETWLRGLPRIWRSGNIAVVHAAADPDRPIDDQPSDTLTWGHADFARTPRRDGIWVVHGHTIVPLPGMCDGRIAIDTGGYATGILTAAHVSRQGVRFLTT